MQGTFTQLQEEDFELTPAQILSGADRFKIHFTTEILGEEVLNANNALFDNKNMLASVERIRIERRINLILALGGGFTYKQ